MKMWKLVPTINNSVWAVKPAYKSDEYIEPGLPTLPETPEPEITDCSDALGVIANIKAKL